MRRGAVRVARHGGRVRLRVAVGALGEVAGPRIAVGGGVRVGDRDEQVRMRAVQARLPRGDVWVDRQHQGADERHARAVAVLGLLRQRLHDDRLVATGQRGHVRRNGHVLQHHLLRGAGAVGEPAGQQFVIHQREAVLIRPRVNLIAQHLGGDVPGREAAVRVHGVERRHQAVVADLDVPGDEEQVRRLHVQVLEVVLRADHVEGFGGVREVAQQFVARDAGQMGIDALAELVLQLVVGQFHDHDEFGPDHLDPFEGEHERVADLLDLLERGELLAQLLATFGHGRVAGDELDGLVQPAGGFALPHLAEPAAPEGRDEPVTGQRLGAGRFGVRSIGAAIRGRGRWHGRGQHIRREGGSAER